MDIVGIFFIAIGLSMDAFAVSLCKGLRMKHMHWPRATIIALFFGGFQAIMPLIGWAVGRRFEQYIVAFDHWIAFVLLVAIGGKMIYEAMQPKEQADKTDETLDVRELFVLAIATSIDALALGIMFAFLQVDIVPAITLIGTVTFALSLVGVRIGNQLGLRIMKKAEICGGVVLILIGAKILIEHLSA